MKKVDLQRRRQRREKIVLTEIIDITASAPNVPAKTRALFSFSANRRARKKVLSPSSEKRIRRKPDTIPSLKGESPISPANPSKIAGKHLTQINEWLKIDEYTVWLQVSNPDLRSYQSMFDHHCVLKIYSTVIPTFHILTIMMQAGVWTFAQC